MLKIYITWSSCYAFRLHCLDYDVRKSEIIETYSIQERNEKYTHFLVGISEVKEICCTRAIPKSTSNWLIKKIQNREQNFIIWNTYMHNGITSPHSCHPHLGTCCTVTPVHVNGVAKLCSQFLTPSMSSSLVRKGCVTNQTFILVKRWQSLGARSGL